MLSVNAAFIERVVSIVSFVTIVVIRLAVKILRAGLGGNVDDRAAALSVLRLVVVEEDLDFRHRFHVQRSVKPVASPPGITVDSVDADGVTYFASARDRSRAFGTKLFGTFAILYHSGQKPD